jgi:signal transduction histidine kinase
LNIAELKERNPVSSQQDSPEAFILNEILPQLKEHLDKRATEALSSESGGEKDFIDMLSNLVSHIAKRSDENTNLLKSLSNKLNHISEIIELQQRFVGELGTENLCSMPAIISSAIQLFEETFNKKAVSLNTDIEEKTPEVLVDSSMMTQVYINLIKNAVEAMEEAKIDKPSITVSLRTEEKDKQRFLVSRVTDNGPGIPEDVITRLFKFGFSTKEKSHHSRGYGLYSCAETVKKYQGSITIESENGKGTSFVIRLPIRQI